MAIRKRLSKPKKLLYHKRYGSVETPPLDMLVANQTTVGWARLPLFNHSLKAARFPKAFWHCRREDIVCGLIYNHRSGIGPGQGFSVWVATNIVREDIALAVQGYCRREFAETPVLQYVGHFAPKEPYLVKDPCVYTPDAELRLYDKAIAALWEAYEEIHTVRLPS
jgi:hypothetical protein